MAWALVAVVLMRTPSRNACGALDGAMPRLERIEGPLSEIRAVMVDFAFMNLSLKERPRFYTECDMKNVVVRTLYNKPTRHQAGAVECLLHGADSPPIKAPVIPQTASKVSQSPTSVLSSFTVRRPSSDIKPKCRIIRMMAARGMMSDTKSLTIPRPTRRRSPR